MTAPVGCASWCASGHAADYPVCGVDVDEVTLAAGTIADVRVTRYRGDEPVVSVYEHTAGDTLVTTLSVAAARRYGLALLAAVAVASDGVR